MPTEARPKQANFGLTSAEPTPEQALAAAVLRQAVADLHDRQLAPHRRLGAARFLTGPGCRFWCSVAGLDCEVVRARARKAIAKRRDLSLVG